MGLCVNSIKAVNKGPSRFHTSIWYGKSMWFGGMKTFGVAGVKTVKETKIAPRYLFITPPDLAELEQRMRGRGTIAEETLKANLKDATVDIKYGTANGNFHKVVVNDDIEETFHEIRDTLVAWFPHLEKMEVEDDE